MPSLKNMVAAALLIASTQATYGAGLEGAQTLFNLSFPGVPLGEAQAVVGAGTELPSISSLAPGFGFANADVDISASRISFDFLSGGFDAINTYEFSFSGPGVPAITGVSRNAALSTISPPIHSLVFDAHSIAIAVVAGSATPQSALVLDLQLAPVPEPATYALMLAGLATVGVALRRQHSGAAVRSRTND